MKPDEAIGAVPAPQRLPNLIALAAVWGPGILVMLADTDAGNIVTAAQAGTQWGFRLLPLPLLLIPVLYLVQEMTVRLGLIGGRGFGAMVRVHLGSFWAWVAAAALTMAALSSIITELDGIAGVGELYGAPRAVVLALSAACLLGIILSGEYRIMERIAVAIGLFELAFFYVAWAAQPSVATMAHHALDQKLSHSPYLYLGAALIGATFNPWMIFYHPSALAEKRLGPAHYTAARWDTAIGALLTQLVTGAVLVAAAATLGLAGAGTDGLESVGQISEALTPFLGPVTGRLIFGMGVVGASMVAAIVCSLALAWGLGEIAGRERAAGQPPRKSRSFCLLYGVCVLIGVIVVLTTHDLVWLSVASQVANALLMPVVVTLLIVLAATALPHQVRIRGRYLWLVIVACALVATAGVIGAAAGLA